MVSQLEGALAEVFAALDNEGNLDEANTKGHIRYLLENGIAGLFVSGIAAEGLTFDEGERLSWLKIAVKEANHKVPVIFNISNLDLRSVSRAILEATNIGADVISITQPFPLAFSDEEIIDYFNSISTMTKLPIMLYNEPAIGNPIKIGTVKNLFKSIPNLKYYKDSTKNLIDLHELMSVERLPIVMAGSDALIYDIMVSGGSGIISLIIDVFPKLIVDLVNEIKHGNLKEAFEKQLFILKVRSVLKKGGLTSGYRYASELVGHHLGDPRSPYSGIDEKNKNLIRDSLIKMNLI